MLLQDWEILFDFPSSSSSQKTCIFGVNQGLDVVYRKENTLIIELNG